MTIGHLTLQQFREWGRKGGAATKAKTTAEEWAARGRKGGLAKAARYGKAVAAQDAPGATILPTLASLPVQTAESPEGPPKCPRCKCVLSGHSESRVEGRTIGLCAAHPRLGGCYSA